MILFLAIVFIILFAAHALVYNAFASIFFSGYAGSFLWLRIIFIVLSLSFIIGSVLSSRYDSLFTRGLYVASAVWIGFLLYFFLASVPYFVLSGLFSGSWVRIAGYALFGIAAAAGLYGLWNANTLRVTRITVELPNLPAAWNGRTAVFLSDMHLGQVRNAGFAKKVADAVSQLQPDAVFNGGDLFDGVAGDPYAAASPFSELHPPLGSYFISGNHEEFTDKKQAYEDAARKAGMRVLDNEVMDLNGVQLAGVDYQDTRDPAAFARILSDIHLDASKPSILLKHVPFNLDIAEQAGISFQLSGHTHRAQLFPLNYITKEVYDGYDYGLKKFGSLQVFTSDGAGTWGPPMRVGTNSEIVLITFRATP